jgi:hypothetical protein
MRQPSKLRDSYATRVLRFKVSELAGIYFPRHKALNPVSQSSAAGKLTNLVKLPACCVAIISLALLGLTFATPAMAEFGIERFAVGVQNQNGTPDVQAGSHPYALTASFVLKQPPCIDSGELCLSESELKDARFELPPGVVGDPDAIPRCTYQEFVNLSVHETGNCANETAVGVATGYTGKELEVGGSGERRYFAISDPVFNLVPPPGVVAEFGFIIAGEVPVLLQASVRTGTDYGVTTSASDIPQAKWITATKVTIWGVPASPSHNPTRGDCEYSGTGHGVPESTNEAPDEVVGYGLRAGEDELETPAAAYPGSGRGLPVSLGDCESQAPQVPLLTLPTSCGVSRKAALDVDDWKEPGNFATGEHVEKAEVSLPALTGCEKVGFSPTLTVTPDKPDASTSSGLAVNVKLPQQNSVNPTGSDEGDVRNTTVVLPPGVALNPSAANGLEACSATPGDLALGPPGQLGSPGDQIGFEGFHEYEDQPGVSLPTFTPALPGSILADDLVDTRAFAPGENVFQAGLNFCGNASKVGTVRIKTPLLEHELTGAVYLAAQEANPFGSLMAVYFIAEEPERGVLVKLPGEVTLCKSVGEDPRNASGELIPGVNCQAVGQVVTTLQNTPDIPFSEFEAHFYGGEKAPLTTPADCGTYTTKTSFVSWAGETKNPSAPMEITSGPNGGSCTYPGQALPFSPALTGGALNLNAGAFSPFTLTMNRSDGEQNMQSVEAKLPAGLAGILTGVELCPEPQANLGECGPNSLIGETTVSVGVGGDPYTVTGGKFYLTGPYNGSGGCNVLDTLPGGTHPPGGTESSSCAPFGITFEVPAKAGPFDLANTKLNHPSCDCIIVRGKIEINPITAAITITSNPPGTPDAIPTSIEGIPLEIQHINAITTRGNFQFNPTNCSKMEVTGTIHSTEGGADTIGVPFQVTNCPSLKFEPKLAVSTLAKTSKADGASLGFKFTNPGVGGGGGSGGIGSYANYAKFKVELPKQLPSRLTTLQKACTQAQFQANPAGCPAASVVGHMKVLTPVLPVPLEGPLYFVSNGGEAFPNLIVVLQGYGVKAELVGDTFISKSGITSSTFKAIPDFPFTSAEVLLPEGKYSALAANGSLCQEASKLKIPTEFVAQNGAELKQDTQISVTGCSSALSVVSSKVNKKTLTLSVYAPAAGKVTASGKGVSAGVKTYSGEGALTFTLKQKQAGKLKTKVKLTFIPSKGKDRTKQAKTLSVRFKK